MKIVLLGKNGQLGWELQRTLPALGSLAAWDVDDFDLRDSALLTRKIREVSPTVIVNAAAYTDVDKAERESEVAMAINATTPGILAEEAKGLGAVLIHYSTDYVFDGVKSKPYTETDEPGPLNAYGRSKLAGEQAVSAAGGPYVILRTAWVYSLRGNSFVNKVLKWARQQQELRIVNDQVSNPTWARMLAEATALLLARAYPDAAGWFAERKGLYHLAGSGFASRFDWANAILEEDPRKGEQVVRQVLPALTSEFPTPARRPLYSALDDSKFGRSFGLGMPDWRQTLRKAMQG